MDSKNFKENKNNGIIDINKGKGTNEFSENCILLKDNLDEFVESYKNDTEKFKELFDLKENEKIPFTKDQIQEFVGIEMDISLFGDEEVKEVKKPIQIVRNEEGKKEFIIDNEIDLLEWYRNNHNDMKIPSKADIYKITGINQSRIRTWNYSLKDIVCIRTEGNNIYITDKGLEEDLSVIENDIKEESNNE